MTFLTSSLADLGWSSFFAAQLDPDDADRLIPVRVIAVYRDVLHVAGAGVDRLIAPFAATGDDPRAATTGDWLLLDSASLRPQRLLRCRSLFKRRAPGTGRTLQLIAANVDTLLIVSSCNQDFNEARLERYLALAREADVTPVVVLTKGDLTDCPNEFARRAARLLPGLMVETVDARDPASVACLAAFCGHGQTVALVGSSGVGKSTLVNTLTGSATIATQSVREDDDRGRHTTTARSLHRLPAGGWLLDTPGMRELQLTEVSSGLDDVFADLVALATACRYGNCRHRSEPGCAVLAGIAAGSVDEGRFRRWRKLVAEEAHNSASLAERRASARDFARMTRRIVRDKEARRRE